ncbi:gliding motility-associated C-terminal domain-containing protein [Desertivirga xinjiangensis]|uniref:gliding motility-associated C-terminal domain-containing protein n=1 Tax=Desertivirga xinjiangensis TaxID=539206 RepID=UPI00210868F8|nr:gliding motility-associated C-terminal domain-containing protein [Pedobacter xinjiangensis]
MKKLVFIFLVISSSSVLGLKAQLVNNNQLIHVENDGLLYIDGNYVHKSGLILGEGDIKLTGDWTNSSSDKVFLRAGTVTVSFVGGSQSINGTKTAFPNLRISGSADKSLGTDTEISGSLSLNDLNLHVRRYSLSVLSPDVNAISRGSGFITTDDRGFLLRNTNSAQTYMFPLGSTEANPLYPNTNPLFRPLSFVPEDSRNNTFAASLNNYDPNAEFSRNNLGSSLKNVSDRYFFVLSQVSGISKAKVNFYQNTAVENNTAIVDWNRTLSVWEKLSTDLQDGMFNGFNRVLSHNFGAGIRDLPVTFASVATTAQPLKFYNAFSPDGDGRNDTWLIPDIDLYPDNNLTIFNRWGDEVFKASSYSNARPWDGSGLQSGTYFYVLNVNVNGDKQTFKGFITMVKGN